MYYKIVAPKHAGGARTLSETLSALGEDKAMQADYSRLSKACCAPQRVSGLDGAPIPTQVDAVACPAC